MALTMTKASRRTAIATLLLLGGQLSVPVAWAQAPSMPASGAPASGAPAAGAKAAGPPGASAAPTARPAAPAASREGTGNSPWPREATEGGRTFTVYQPQIEEWDGTRLHARAAVSVESAASPVQHFGVVWFSARAEVDKASRLVALADFRVDKVAFPSEPDRAAEYQKVLERRLPREMSQMSLDRIQAALAVTEAQRGGAAKPQPVKNDPPRIIVSTTPALLVLVDGNPVLRPVEGSSLQRIVNSWALLLVDPKSGKHYLRALERWFEASKLDGPWTVTRPPATLDAAMRSVAKSQRVNLLDEPGPDIKDAIARGAQPTIYVSTAPAELVQTRGRPDYEPVEGTDLLHVANTSASIILDPADQRHYLLLSGRWFRGASLTEGPWEFVPHDKLPAAFARIPDTHPRGAVLASVPGTPQSKEALIDNSIPQTAEVSRATTKYQATYDGAPKFQPIEGTSLHYATNSPVPVIQVDAKTYYSLKDGVWFAANAPMGPWTVATTVPAAIYTIPPSSPLHYVTYVHVYSSTPQTVYVGYTPGYYGTVVAPSSVVVYGTGYAYPPVYVGSYWYPPPPTYGYGAGFGWGAVTGFAFGAMTTAIWGGAWGCCGYDDIDIDRTVNINRNDAYNRWNQNQVRSNLESRAQSLTPQQRQQVQQRAQTRAQGGTAPRSNDVYAGRDGNAYRRGAQGWEQNSGQGWDRANFSGGRETAADLNRQQQARSAGAARESSYQGNRSSSGYSGVSRSGGGGARGGGGRGGGGGRRR
jgi:hypothetical protein